RFEVATAQDFGESQKTEWLKAVPDHDFIVKRRVEGLRPGTRYYYRVAYGPDEKSTRLGPVRSFKTLAGPDAAVEVNFVVVTGMNYNGFYRGSRAYKGPDRELGYPALKTILDAKPDFFVGTGDNVYYDSGPKHAQKPDELRRFWHEQFVQPRMIDLMGQVASYWEKDDHDTRYNDADNTGSLEPLPALGKEIFNEQMPVVDPADPKALPYRTYRVSKDLQIWMTEGRDYRSANMSNDPNKTMWGAEQLQWLERTLLESDATFKILISPTPMVGPDDINRIEFMGNAGGRGARGRQAQSPAPAAPLPAAVEGQDELKRDNMTNAGGFRRERDQFFAWLRQSGVLKRNFYIICGDRHWQYYSIDPSGVEELSTGAIIDENSRMGRAPGDPLGNDPRALIKQPFTSKEPSGGFLEATVQPGSRPRAIFRFYDEHGVELYAVTKEATTR
ncbi:MAG: alkaline phosphatase D family protein, partial [Chloroflexota bacterium]|nr:alkaline phosphatase D family protein [Chloroflexota bacterium]